MARRAWLQLAQPPSPPPPPTTCPPLISYTRDITVAVYNYVSQKPAVNIANLAWLYGSTGESLLLQCFKTVFLEIQNVTTWSVFPNLDTN